MAYAIYWKANQVKTNLKIIIDNHESTIFIIIISPNQISYYPSSILLNYSNFKCDIWVIQCIINIFTSPCVTCTILSKCYHTLFSSVLLHYSILLWIYSHGSFLKPYPCFCQTQDFYHYIASCGIILSNHGTCHPNPQSISYKPSFKPYLSHHRNHKKLKC
jgi:hypothetical protein